MNENEARDAIIQAARFSADWWINRVTDKPCDQRIRGAIFTFLAELDGCGDMPAADLIVDGTRVSTMLHEHLYDGWER